MTTLPLGIATKVMYRYTYWSDSNSLGFVPVRMEYKDTMNEAAEGYRRVDIDPVLVIEQDDLRFLVSDKLAIDVSKE